MIVERIVIDCEDCIKYSGCFGFVFLFCLIIVVLWVNFRCWMGNNVFFLILLIYLYWLIMVRVIV